jgi:hypothetical protein
MISTGQNAPAKSLFAFFTLTYAVTWAFWFGASELSGGLAESGRLRPGLATLLFYAGVFAPALVAIAMTAYSRGSVGLRALLLPLFRWRVGLRWYVFAMTYLAAVKVATAVVHRVAAGEWPAFGWQGLPLMLAATVGSTLIGGQAGEEIGWRGYALPRLTERFGLAGASVILGVIWACWHLPLFFVPGTTTTGQSFPLYLVQVTALSVAIAWLYARSNGSLLLVMLMHAAINNTRNIVPAVARDPANPLTPAAPLLGWITAALLWIGAAYFIVRMIRLESSRDRGEEEVRSAKGEGRKKTPSSIRT